MILGTGVDVIEVARIQKAAAKASFIQGVFTKGEQAFLQAHGNDPCHMAGLFAAKEAVSKALGTGFSLGIGLKDIEIRHRESGAPYAVLHGAAEKRRKELGGGQVHVSISHIQAIAMAQAIMEDGSDTGSGAGVPNAGEAAPGLQQGR